MIWLWLGFVALVAVLLVVYRKVGSAISERAWSVAVIVVALGFAGFVYLVYEHAWFGATLYEPSDQPGIDALSMFVTAYVLEFLLAVDNNFVTDFLFRRYGVSPSSQPKLLFWALVGSIPLRLLALMACVLVLRRFTALFLLFGAYCAYQGVKLLRERGDEEEEEEEADAGHAVKRLLRRFYPIVLGDHGGKFSVVRDGVRYLTLVSVCLAELISIDFVFALDSIGVLSASKTIWIVVTSNILATVGLRSFYFCRERFDGLSNTLGVVLVLVGLTMMASGHLHVPPPVFLVLIAGSVATTAWISVVRTRRRVR